MTRAGNHVILANSTHWTLTFNAKYGGPVKSTLAVSADPELISMRSTGMNLS